MSSGTSASAPILDQDRVCGFTHRERNSTTILQANALSLLPAQLTALGVKKPMLITGASVRQQPSYQRVLESLQPWQPVVLSPVPSHASVRWVTEAAHVAQAHGVDAFIAYGGGSCCDTA